MPGITWGWFQGGFAPNWRKMPGRAGVVLITSAGRRRRPEDRGRLHSAPRNRSILRANNQSASSAASSVAKDRQNTRQPSIRITDFFDALKMGHLPAVSYLKRAPTRNGHAGYSDPIDEQIFVVGLINALMQSKEWKETSGDHRL